MLNPKKTKDKKVYICGFIDDVFNVSCCMLCKEKSEKDSNEKE